MQDHAHFDNPLAGAARMFSGRPKALEHLGSVDEISGWKVARLISPLDGRFGGLAFGQYGMSGIARCDFANDHLPPVVGCECGFHALDSRSRAEGLLAGRRAGLVLLKVELYGTAVKHSLGYRAEEQDVVEIHLPPRCARLTCRATTVGVRPKGRRWLATCVAHSRPGTVNLAEMHAALGVDVLVLPSE
jgi:hypothetical protein